MEKKWWEEGNDVVAAEGTGDAKHSVGEGSSPEQKPRSGATVKSPSRTSHGVRWPLVLRWWAVSGAVAALLIAAILIHAKRADEDEVGGALRAPAVAVLTDRAPSRPVDSKPTASASQPALTVELGRLDAPPSAANLQTCSSNLNAIQAALGVAWPKPEHVSAVQGWRQFARSCRDVASTAPDGRNLAAAIAGAKVSRAEADPGDPPSVVDRPNCSNAAEAIRQVEADRLPVGDEAVRLVNWRAFIDGCHRVSPELWTSQPTANVQRPWPPSAATRESCVGAIDTINAAARRLNPEPSDVARLNAWTQFTNACGQLAPAPFTGDPGSFVVRKEASLPAAPTVEEATEATCAARLPILNQVRVDGSNVEGIKQWNAFQAACQKIREGRNRPASNAASAAVAANASESGSPTGATTAPKETVPPVPPTVTAQTCALGLSTLNRVHASTGSLTEREQAWAGFGYACLALSPPALVADSNGYALSAKSTPKPTAEASTHVPHVDASAPATATKHAPALAATATVDRSTCENRLLDMNSANGKPATQMTTAEREAIGISAACLRANWIVATRNGFAMSSGSASSNAVTAASAAGSDRKCVMKGAVVSQDGSPLPGAKVVLTGQGISVNATLTTDANGGWVSEPLPDGSVLMAITADRHLSSRSTVAVCQSALLAPVRLETCNAFSCAARRLDEKLHLGGH